NFVKDWLSAHPDRVMSVLYVTDGVPSECDTDVASLTAIAAAGLSGVPSVHTFVVGVGNAEALYQLARAGATGVPYLVDQGPNVLDALAKAVAPELIPCTVVLPLETQPFDWDDVDVSYQPGDGGMPVSLERVGSAADC